MSNKGKVFERGELSKAYRSRHSIEVQQARCAEMTERNKIVAYDGEVPLIAEELQQRAINKLPPKARRIAGMLLACDPETRAAVMSAFYQEGDLIIPFNKVA